MQIQRLIAEIHLAFSPNHHVLGIEKEGPRPQHPSACIKVAHQTANLLLLSARQPSDEPIGDIQVREAHEKPAGTAPIHGNGYLAFRARQQLGDGISCHDKSYAPVQRAASEVLRLGLRRHEFAQVKTARLKIDKGLGRLSPGVELETAGNLTLGQADLEPV